MALTAATSPSSLPQSSTGRLEVNRVLNLELNQHRVADFDSENWDSRVQVGIRSISCARTTASTSPTIFLHSAHLRTILPASSTALVMMPGQSGS